MASNQYKSQVFLGTIVKDGAKNKLAIHAPKHYQHFLNETCRPDDAVAFYVTNRRPKRSLMLNNFVHLYFSLIALSSGHTTEEIKAWAKGKYLSMGITEVFGTKVRKTKNTSDLNTSETIEMLARVENDTGIPLPDTSAFKEVLDWDEYARLKAEQKSKYSAMVPNLE